MNNDGRNEISIWTFLDAGAEPVSHFKFSEFEDKDRFVMVHQSVPFSLEMLRHDLGKHYKREVCIRITGATRTPARNRALAARLGWVSQGGKVSANSRHLARYGGVAVDIVAYFWDTKKPVRIEVPQCVLGGFARGLFDFVKDDYADGHVHCDNRKRAGA